MQIREIVKALAKLVTVEVFLSKDWLGQMLVVLVCSVPELEGGDILCQVNSGVLALLEV